MGYRGSCTIGRITSPGPHKGDRGHEVTGKEAEEAIPNKGEEATT